jgi:hypothetical protein
MSTGGRRIAAIVLLLLAAVLGWSGSAQATTFGSSLAAVPNTGICAVPAGAEKASCTYSQLLLADGHAAPGGVQPREEGVITSFRVSSGPVPPGTESVKLRLRLLDLNHGYALTGGRPYVEMPLEPGIHEFPSDFPALKGMPIGLETVVAGVPGNASAPLARDEAGVGSLYGWIPSPPEASIPPPASEENRELLFNFTVEPDRDHDGFGDRTQDHCPEDPRRQNHCDRTPPRVKVRYVRRQDFLGDKKIVMFARSSEPGKIYASGQVELPEPSVTWGIYGDSRRVGKEGRGGWARLVLHVPAQAREHAARSFAHGRRVFAKVFVTAVDRFGNQSRHPTVVIVKPR